MQKNIRDRKKRNVPGLLGTQTSWAVRLLVASITARNTNDHYYPTDRRPNLHVYLWNRKQASLRIRLFLWVTEWEPALIHSISPELWIARLHDAPWLTMFQPNLSTISCRGDGRIPRKLRPWLAAGSVTAGSRAMYVSSHSYWSPRLHIGQHPFLPVKES